MLDPLTKEHLFAAEDQCTDQENIFALIDRLAHKAQLGLKVREVDDIEPSSGISDITTTNFDAYHHFFKAMDFWYKLQDGSAEAKLRKAINIDSTFGLAYGLLAYIRLGTESEELARSPLNKAMKYIDQIPEKEKYLVRAINEYFSSGSKAAIIELEKMKHRYPDDKRVYLGLGYFHYRALQFDEANANFKEVLKLDPASDRAMMFLKKIAIK